MTRETKFGLLLVLVLTSVFGLLIYKRIHQPAGLQAQASGPELEEREEDDPFGDPASESASPADETGPTFGSAVIHAVAETPKTAPKPVVKPAKPKLPTNLDEDAFSPPAKTTTSAIKKTAAQTSATTSDPDPFGEGPAIRSVPVKPPVRTAPPQASEEADPFGSTESTSTASTGDEFDPLDTSATAQEAPAFADDSPNRTEAAPEFGEPDPLDGPAANRVQEKTAESRTVITVEPRIIIQEEEEELLGVPFEPPTTPAKTSAARSPAAALGGDSYVVQPGDNFWTISKKVYGAGRYFQALTAYNAKAYPDPKLLKPGDVIRTPATSQLESQFGKLISPLPSTAATTATPAKDDKPAAEVEPGFFLGTRGEPLYRIGSEDTLTGIARQNLGRSSRWVQIFEMNRDVLKDSNALTVGTVLRLPADASGVRAVNQEPTGR